MAGAESPGGSEIITDVQSPVQDDSGGNDGSFRAVKRQKQNQRSTSGAHEDDDIIVGSQPPDLFPLTISATSLKVPAPASVVGADEESRNGASEDSNDQEASTNLRANEHVHDQPAESIEVGKSRVNAEQDEPGGENPLPKPAANKRAKLVKSSKRSAPPRKSRSKYDDPLEMLTNQRSPLGTAMLRDLLCDPRAWDVLNMEERQKVLKEFPNQSEILDPGTSDARPNIALLRNNNNFRHDISRYQEDLREGRHDPEWIAQAQAAHRKRELGVYDDFLANMFLEEWGVPMHETKGITPRQELAEGGSAALGDINNNEGHVAEPIGTEAPPGVAARIATDSNDGVEPSGDVNGNLSTLVAARDGHDGTRKEVADGDTIIVAHVPVSN